MGLVGIMLPKRGKNYPNLELQHKKMCDNGSDLNLVLFGTGQIAKKVYKWVLRFDKPVCVYIYIYFYYIEQ